MSIKKLKYSRGLKSGEDDAREIVAEIKRQDFIGMFSLCQYLLFIAFFFFFMWSCTEKAAS